MGIYLTGTDYELDEYDGADMFNWPDLITGTGSMTLAWKAGNAILIDDPFGTNRGTVLEVKSYRDVWGIGTNADSPIASGVGTKYKLDVPGDLEEFYMAMDVAVHTDFIFPWGIHTWSASTEDAIADTAEELLALQFSCLFNLSAPPVNGVEVNGGNSLPSYYYNRNKAQRYSYWTDDPAGNYEYPSIDPAVGYKVLNKGEWNKLEHYFKLNSVVGGVDQGDGVLQAWLNGVLVQDLQGFPWRTDDTLKFHDGSGQFTTWYGGSGTDWACPQDQSIFFDNLIISTNPITHGQPDYVFEANWNYWSAPHIFTLDSELDIAFNIDTAEDVYTVKGIELNPTMSIVADPAGTQKNVLKVLFPADEGDYPSMRIYCGFGSSWTNIPYPNSDPWGGDYILGGTPGPSDPVWDLHDGAPVQSQFDAREVLRNNGTEQAYEELYFSYEMMLSPNWFYDFATKLNGIATGFHLQASHGPVAFPQGTYGQTWRCQMHNDTAFGNPNGALVYYMYSSERVQKSIFLRRDGVLPASLDWRDSDFSTMDWDKCYVVPKDTWVNIEMRVKLSTAIAIHPQSPTLESDYDDNEAQGDGNLKDGIVEVWVTDPRPVTNDTTSGTDGVPVKMLSILTRFRWHTSLKIDKMQFNAYTNDAAIIHSEDQYMYIGETIVSEKRIRP